MMAATSRTPPTASAHVRGADPDAFLAVTLAILGGAVLGAPDGTMGITLSGDRIVGFVRAGDLPLDIAHVVDLRPHLLAPGAIDLHVHGGDGIDLATTDEQGFAHFAMHRAATGTTGTLATIALPWDALLAQVARYARWVADPSDTVAATLLGVHVEGPFLNLRRKGALPPESFRAPSIDDVDRLLDAGEGAIRMMTIAPELPGALAVIARLVDRGVVASLGHSDATFEEATDGIRAGATKATHTFNAMRPFLHRDPGIIGAVLANPGVVAELIADGHHVHPGALATAIRACGPDRVALVTDNVPQAGLPDGVYRSGTYGDPPMIVRNGVANLGDAEGNPTATISGSVGPIGAHLRVVRALPDQGITEDDAFAMAATTPARVLGLDDRGRLAPGLRADLAAWDPVTGECVATIVGGVVVWRAPR
jgi:N-acetylglucosamine-6-phosphate deacetylase